MMKYYKIVFVQACVDTLILVGLREFRLKRLIFSTITCVITYYVFHEVDSVKNFLTSSVSKIIAVLLLLPLVFVYCFIRVIPRIDKEKTDKIEDLECLYQKKRKQKKIATKLWALVEKGQSIPSTNRAVIPKLPGYIKECIEFMQETLPLNEVKGFETIGKSSPPVVELKEKVDKLRHIAMRYSEGLEG